MSDLAATNCGCGCDNNGGIGNIFGGDNCCSTLIILLILFCFCGNNDRGCGGFDSNNSCLWIILLLFFCGGCGNNGCC